MKYGGQKSNIYNSAFAVAESARWPICRQLSFLVLFRNGLYYTKILLEKVNPANNMIGGG